MNDKFITAYTTILKDRYAQLVTRFSVVPTDKEQQKADIIEMLRISHIDEFLAEFNYFYSYTLSVSAGKADYDPEFKEHEDEERSHRYDIVERLKELQAQIPMPPFDAYRAMNSRGDKWKEEDSIVSLTILQNRLAEEEQAVEWYGLCVNYLKNTDDSTTLALFKRIKAEEEKHVKDLRDFLNEHNYNDGK